MTLSELKDRLEQIKSLGFVRTHRNGDTGIGKTLEDLLNIKENNIPLPDIGEIGELKTYRKKAGSMLTLFTLEPQPKGGDRDRILLDHFGYSRRSNGRSKELHSTLSCRRYNNQGLKLKVEEDKIRITGKGRRLNIYWDIESLRRKFKAKLPALVYVLADSKKMEGSEYFHFNQAYRLKGFAFKRFRDMVNRDHIVVDLRMYYRPDKSVRNHGTGFRVKINRLYDCFDKREKLL